MLALLQMSKSQQYTTGFKLKFEPSPSSLPAQAISSLQVNAPSFSEEEKL